ncbi:MarR family winged helix-turn-helix transcriptional regulator [Nonomuraea sp. NPDC004186]
MRKAAPSPSVEHPVTQRRPKSKPTLDALGIDGASVTRLVKEFEAEGLVGRRLDPADNRYTLSALTSAGERVAADLERSHQAYQERLLDGVTPQQQEIVLGVLHRIRANMIEQESR